jgi:hypothetical protein
LNKQTKQNLKKELQNQMEHVHEATYYRLRQYGREGDSYEDILKKLMDVVDGKRKRSSVVITDGACIFSLFSSVSRAVFQASFIIA